LPAHAEFTARFAAALQGAPLPPGVTGAEAETRFAVYRNNVAHSLGKALAARFPVIERLVGAPFFAAMAQVYLAAHRPETPVLHQWGQSFPDFLAGFEPLSAYPYMADVAKIEHARGLAFHAADAAPLNPARLAGADPARLRLALHPSVQLLRLVHPAVSIWAANQPGAEAGPLPDTPEIALILRTPDFAVPVRAISPGDSAMIDSLGAGSSLLAAAEAAQWFEPGHDPNPLLLHLMQCGALTDPEAP
jgi:hypothetical protein